MSRRRHVLTMMSEAALFLSLGWAIWSVARQQYSSPGHLAGRAADLERMVQSFAAEVRAAPAPAREPALLHIEAAARELRAAEAVLRGSP